MGLISRVSSRTYRKPQKKYQKILNFEHGPLHHQQTPKEKQPAGFRYREQRRSDPSRNPKQRRCRNQRTTYAASRCCRQRNRCWRTKRFDLDGPSSTSCRLAKSPNQNRSRTRKEILWQTRFSHWRPKGHGKRSPKSRCQMLQTKTTNQPKCQTRPKLFWKTAFTQLKSPVNESDTSWTILPSSKHFWTEVLKLPLSTKSPPFLLFTNDGPERTSFLNFQN